MENESDQQNNPSTIDNLQRRSRALERVYRNKAKNRRPLAGPKESKISNTTILLMSVVVIFYEVINGLLDTFLPFIGPFLSGIVADLHFFIWFKIKGVNFTRNPKRALGWMTSLFFNEVEVLDEVSLPLGVAFTILSVRAEEKLENNPLIGGIATRAVKKVLKGDSIPNRG